MPPYSEVFRRRGYLAIFLAAALSTWGDYLARVAVAAFVLEPDRIAVCDRSHLCRLSAAEHLRTQSPCADR